MNFIRRHLIKAYFEATWYEEDQLLDYESRELVALMDKFLNTTEHGKEITLKGNGAAIQCDEGMMPPTGFIIDGETMKEGDNLEVAIETDKFCNVENVWWERV